MNFCRTSQYKKSAIPFCQRLANEYCYWAQLEDEEEGERDGEEGGEREVGGREKEWGVERGIENMNYDLYVLIYVQKAIILSFYKV